MSKHWMRIEINMPGIRDLPIYMHKPNETEYFCGGKYVRKPLDFNSLIPVPEELTNHRNYKMVLGDCYAVLAIIYYFIQRAGIHVENPIKKLSDDEQLFVKKWFTQEPKNLSDDENAITKKYLDSEINIPVEKLSDDEKLVIKNQWGTLLNCWGMAENITEDLAKAGLRFTAIYIAGKNLEDAAIVSHETVFKDGEIYIENARKYGAATASMWRYLNWGTPYNAIGAINIGKDELLFDAVTDNPKPIIEALARKFQNRPISVRWYDLYDKTIRGNATCNGRIWSYQEN